jgi:hypothetical protein
MRKYDTNFKEPKDVREAKDRLVVLRVSIEEIDEQLGIGTKPYPGMLDDEYERWQKNARAAKRWKEVETKWLRNWMEVNNFTHLKPEDVSAGGLLLASLPILNSAAEKGLVDDGSQVILEAVRGYVKNRFPSVGGLVTGTIALEEISAP